MQGFPPPPQLEVLSVDKMLGGAKLEILAQKLFHCEQFHSISHFQSGEREEKMSFQDCCRNESDQEIVVHFEVER